MLDKDLNWKKLQQSDDGPEGRYGHFLGSYDNKLIVFGGKSSKMTELNDLWVYNLDSNQWMEIVYTNIIPNVPQTKFMPSGSIIDNYGVLLLFGGKSQVEDTNIYLLKLDVLSEIISYREEHRKINYNSDIEYISKISRLWQIIKTSKKYIYIYIYIYFIKI
jgi:hypothetical protein